MQVARHTRPECHIKVWATIYFFLPEAIASYSWGRNMINPVQLMRMYGLTALPPLLYEAYDTRVTTATRIHSADQTPELESGALNRWAMTRHVSCF